MNILISAATDKEIQLLLKILSKKGKKSGSHTYSFEKNEITFLLTGVGSMQTAVAISTFQELPHFDLLLQVGIAGSYSPLYPLGTVVEVISEQLGDLGAEMADGSFQDVFELGLTDKNHVPFSAGKIHNTRLFTHLPKVKGLTVNKVHGSQDSIAKIIEKYNPDIETMEGAGFFYTAFLTQKPFCQLRGISNMVEPRNRDHWNIPLAMENVTRETLILLEKYC